ncbi:MAG: right-handed parallel beta-helix repeat-containing protein [Candidatus Krumholzibacteria bacterium]|jgi:hypothetical protein|nr:right-handed parallel beta-helix repeat-containing protein [Candidatus Krumholzibacteria bacterium]MDP7022011.1 right-handed parallel beta-helix repeat-containing protein [Candidatus Krumholzibacteria bacterium]
MRTAFQVALILIFFLAIPVLATTYMVLPDGSGFFPDIKTAIQNTWHGDLILLGDGTFTGPMNCDLDFGGKLLSIESASGNPENCIIDCGGSPAEPHRGFWLHTNEGAGCLIRGITIRNGYGYGAGIYLAYGARPTIQNCIIEDNHAGDGSGGGIACREFSAPTISNCIIRNNTAEYGGGVYIFQSYPSLSSCDIIGNEAYYLQSGVNGSGGGVRMDWSSPDFTDCLIADNHCGDRVGGLAACQSSPTLVGCTIAGNSAPNDVGGFDGIESQLHLERCLIWGNQSDFGMNDVRVGVFSVIYFDTCDWNPLGTRIDGTMVDFGGNLNLDPWFCDSGDWTVQGNSPCLPPNNWSGVLIGARGEGCPDPAVEPMNWSVLKSLF